jgi:hypothetical protein
MEVPDDTPETDERCRTIERGSKLVSVMPSIFAVVLQAPRGNIETIYPRALVLAGVRTFIDQKKYRSAFLACRSQMVDLNILHDYAPEQFMENIALFIDQVKRIDYIDDFISRLSYVEFPRIISSFADTRTVRTMSRRHCTKTHSKYLRLYQQLLLSRKAQQLPLPSSRTKRRARSTRSVMRSWRLCNRVSRPICRT